MDEAQVRAAPADPSNDLAGWGARAAALRGHVLWLLAAVGVAYAVLIPPVQSPDEGDHLKRAYALSVGRLVIETPAGGQSGFQVDTGLLAYVDNNCYFERFHCETFVSTSRRGTNADLRWQRTEKFSQAPGTGYYFPLIYAPQAAGLALGRWSGRSIQGSYYLARLFVLGAGLALLALAFRQLPANPLVLALLVLPISLFQMVSASQDGIATALTVLAASLYLRGADLRRDFPWPLSLALAATVFVLASGRIYLLPMLALPLFVAWRRRSRRDAGFAFGAVIAAICWCVLAFALTTDSRMARDLTTAQSAVYYGSHPAQLLRVLWSTVTDMPTLLRYRDTFIGVLGWLDTPFSTRFYQFALAATGAAAVLSFSPRAWREDRASCGLLAVVAMSCAVLVLVALLVAWTPYPATLVAGVQGRYFLAPAVMMACAIGGGRDTVHGVRALLAIPIWLLGFALTVFLTTNLLLERYYAPAAIPSAVGVPR